MTITAAARSNARCQYAARRRSAKHPAHRPCFNVCERPRARFRIRRRRARKSRSVGARLHARKGRLARDGPRSRAGRYRTHDRDDGRIEDVAGALDDSRDAGLSVGCRSRTLECAFREATKRCAAPRRTRDLLVRARVVLATRYARAALRDAARIRADCRRSRNGSPNGTSASSRRPITCASMPARVTIYS